MNLEEKIEKVFWQCIKRRFPDVDDIGDWSEEQHFGSKLPDHIRELFEKHDFVRGGYYPTSVRGYHRTCLQWRDKKKKK